jgi:WD40 repeat protein
MALGVDADVVYVFGERDGSVMLERWCIDTGVRLGTSVIARGAVLSSDVLWRSDRDDDVLVGVRSAERNELLAVTLDTASVATVLQGGFRGCWIAAASAVPIAGLRLRDDEHDVQVLSRDALLGVHDRHARAIAFSPNGTRVAWIDPTLGCMRVREALGDVAFRESVDRFAPSPSTLALSDDASLVWGAVDREVRCWSADTAEVLASWRAPVRVGALVGLSPDGRAALFDGPVAYALGDDQAIDAATLRWCSRDARLSPDGLRLASARGAVLSGTFVTRRTRWEFHDAGHDDAIVALARSFDDTHVVSTSRDRTMRIWSTHTGEVTHRFESDGPILTSVAFAPDGRSLYTLDDEGTVAAWSPEAHCKTADGVSRLPGTDALVVSPDGRHLLATRRATLGSVALLDTTTLAPAPVAYATAPITLNAAEVAAFSPRAAVLYALTFDGDFAETLQALRVDLAALQAMMLPPVRLAMTVDVVLGFSRSGTYFVVAERDEALTLHVLDVEVSFVERYRAVVNIATAPLAWTLGDHRAALADADGVLHVLDYVSATVMRINDPLRTRVTTLLFAHDEATLYVGTENGQVRVYGLDAAQQ